MINLMIFFSRYVLGKLGRGFFGVSFLCGPPTMPATLLLKQEWLPALCTRRQSTFTVVPVALNSPLDHSAVSLSSHTA